MDPGTMVASDRHTYRDAVHVLFHVDGFLLEEVVHEEHVLLLAAKPAWMNTPNMMGPT